MEERHPPLLWNLAVLLTSFGTVITLGLSISVPIPKDVEVLLVWADTAICLVFFVDFLLMLHWANNKWGYLLKWGLDRPTILNSAYSCVTSGPPRTNRKNPSFAARGKINNCANPGINQEQTTNSYVHSSVIDWNDFDVLEHCNPYR